MGFEQRTKTAITALALFLEGCAAELATRTPAEEPAPLPPPPASALPPAPPELAETPEQHADKPRRESITLGQGPTYPSSPTSGEMCTPAIAQAAAALVDHALPIRRSGTLEVNYEIITDEEFDDYYDEDTDRVADYYVAMIEKVTAQISEYADIEFHHQRRARPEEPGDEVWFSVVLSGDAPKGESGLTTVYRDKATGDFAYADIAFFVPNIEKMMQEGARNAARQTVQHEFQHGLGFGHIEDIFPGLVDSNNNYRFTFAISPETSAMTRHINPRFDNRPELDFCATQKLYGAAPAEVDPADAAPAGRSQRTRDRR